MTRIIAGVHGGRRLAVPSGASTRPTTDRVREALFSRLDHLGVLPGARVADLYAGSGALALEALSRGAREAVLVERSRAAARVATRNVGDLGVAARVVVADAAAYLRQEGTRRMRFDLVFLDPPYDLGDTDLARVLEASAPLLAPEAVVVVERSTRSPEPVWPRGVERFATRAHGETTLWFAEPVAEVTTEVPAVSQLGDKAPQAGPAGPPEAPGFYTRRS